MSSHGDGHLGTDTYTDTHTRCKHLLELSFSLEQALSEKPGHFLLLLRCREGCSIRVLGSLFRPFSPDHRGTKTLAGTQARRHTCKLTPDP